MSVSSAARKIADETVVVYENLIGGRWQPASDGRTLDMVSPSDGQVFAKIARGSRADVDAAVKAARHAFEEGAWGKLTATERGRLLTQARRGDPGPSRGAGAARGARQRQADEAGARRHHRGRALLRVLRRRRRQGARRDHPVPRRLHGDDPARAARRHRPHHPVELPGADLRPHAGAGARGGQRRGPEAGGGRLPAPLRLARAGAGGRLSAGRAQRRDRPRRGGRRGARRASAASTTSRSPARRRSARWCRRPRRRTTSGCTLELGGKSPQIVFADADLDAAVPVVVNAIVQNAGQTCSAGSRVLVQQSIYDEFVARCRRALRAAARRHAMPWTSTAAR